MHGQTNITVIVGLYLLSVDMTYEGFTYAIGAVKGSHRVRGVVSPY